MMVTNEIVMTAPIPTKIANSSGIEFAIRLVFRSSSTKYSASPTENRGVKFIPLRAAKNDTQKSVMTQLKNSSNKDVSVAQIIHGGIVLWIDPFAGGMCASHERN